MTRRLNIVATANSFTGYGEHLRQIILGLDRAGIYASVRAIQTQNLKWARLHSDITSRLVTGIQPEDAELIIAPPTLCPTEGKRTAYWTMNECTTLKRDQVAILNKSQVVIVPCTWNASCFSAGGVTSSIRIAHLGIDSEIFFYREPDIRNGIVFGCGGFLANGVHRKGIDTIIKTFKAAFHGQGNVRLEIKCSPACQINPESGDSRITIFREFWTQKKLAEWYARLTAFINIGTGGWELMAHEAMAVGRPLIAPHYGGMADYFNESIGYPVPFTLQIADDAWRHGLWASASTRGIARAMQEVFSNPEKARAIGKRASDAVSALTWNKSTESLLEILDEFDIPQRNHIASARHHPPCVLQLGRYGDIINILPFVRLLSAQHDSPVDIIVSKDYQDILDGVSYCNKIVWNGPMEDFESARNWASVNWARLIATQLHPRSDIHIQLTDAFNKEAWLLAGALDQFGEIPLLFDGRSLNREQELQRKTITDKPCVLFSASGTSSPITNAEHYKTELGRLIGPEFDLIDISGLKAERIYDVLGLMEMAVCLVTTDSAMLHLAAASAVPVVAIIADTPSAWYGTRPLCNVIFKVRYSDASSKLRDIASAVRTVPIGSRIVHLFSDYLSLNQRTYSRKIIAERSWKSQHRIDRWLVDRVSNSMLPRVFEDSNRSLPYIHDLIQHAMLRSRPDDIIVMTNSDTCLAPNFSRKLREHFTKSDALYSYRIDFQNINCEKSVSEIKNGKQYPGCDLFAFKPAWWENNWQSFPDMLLGAEAWDWCMRVLMDETSNGSAEAAWMIYHERHPTPWEIERTTLPSQKHNLALASVFLKLRGIDPKFPI